MASIRKRRWRSPNGQLKEAWVADYFDQVGARHIETFERKKDAEQRLDAIKAELRIGVHTADSKSKTVAEAGKLWLAACEAHGLERSTIDSYRQHVTLHINPFLGREKLSLLTAPKLREFEETLRHGRPATGESEGKARSPAMIKRIIGSLGALIADAQERGLVSRNVVRDLKGSRRRGKGRQAERRQKGKLRVGVDIPSRQEVKALVEALQGRWRPVLLTAIFTGLRASELRGLRWIDVDLDSRELHVRQRADRYNAIGRPKSESGERSVPLPPMVVSALSEWKAVCPPSPKGLVFPNGAGQVENHANLLQRGLAPAQLAAGVHAPALDEKGNTRLDDDGKSVLVAKYTGLHALRHFYASWCINRRVDGGLELPPKVVQERMGHSSITMTLDTYGHLFPRGSDSSEMEAAEQALMA